MKRQSARSKAAQQKREVRELCRFCRQLFGIGFFMIFVLAIAEYFDPAVAAYFNPAK